MPSPPPGLRAPVRARPAGPFGLILPTIPQDSPETPTLPELVDTCRQAEAAGASAIWVCDHLFWGSPVLECLTTATVAVTATERATVGTCVLQLPLRRPAVVAKQAAALARLSGDRFVLGVGMGVHEGEYQAAETDYHARGRELDHGIEALQGFWADQSDTDDHPVAGEPGFYRQLPAPGPIPVWIGGSSAPALQRTARLGDGWIPMFLPPPAYTTALEHLSQEAERAGRDPEHISRAVVAFVAIGDDEAAERGLRWLSTLYGLPARAFARRLVSGNAKACASSLAAWVEAGAEHIAVFFATDHPISQVEDVAEALAAEIGPLDANPVRARTATARQGR